jgi:endoglucanase
MIKIKLGYIKTIAVPCRYIHSPVTVMSKSDLEHMIKLVELFVHDIADKGVDFE